MWSTTVDGMATEIVTATDTTTAATMTEAGARMTVIVVNLIRYRDPVPGRRRGISNAKNDCQTRKAE